jgi:hypothetical protein
MSERMTRIRRLPGPPAALGLGVALLLAASVDAGIWALNHGGSGTPLRPSTHTTAPGQRSSLPSGSLNGNGMAVLVGADGNAAYYILWGRNPGGKLGGQIVQNLVGPALAGETTPTIAENAVSFTGNVSGSRVKIHLVADGFGGLTTLAGRIHNGALQLTDPEMPNGQIAFRPDNNLQRFGRLANRLFFRQERADRRLKH